MLKTEYSVYSNFDVEMHKKTFINYLEVVLLEDGTIEYAVPSHQEKLINLACKKQQISREDLYDKCPREYYADFMTWLSMESGAIPVWEKFYSGELNEKQRTSLEMLKQSGLYKGEI